MCPKSPRLAVRAILVEEGRLLMVNAWPDGQSPLMCAPGGGVEVGSSLPDNLVREVYEETGLRIEVGAPCLVNEFHDPNSTFHQVDVYFRCQVADGSPRPDQWEDPEAIVTQRAWVTQQELAGIPHKPDRLSAVAFDEACNGAGNGAGISYDPLEPLVK